MKNLFRVFASVIVFRTYINHLYFKDSLIIITLMLFDIHAFIRLDYILWILWNYISKIILEDSYTYARILLILLANALHF